MKLQAQAQAQMAAQQAQHAQQQQQQVVAAAAASTGGGNLANPTGATAATATPAPRVAGGGANAANQSNNRMGTNGLGAANQNQSDPNMLQQRAGLKARVGDVALAISTMPGATSSALLPSQHQQQSQLPPGTQMQQNSSHPPQQTMMNQQQQSIPPFVPSTPSSAAQVSVPVSAATGTPVMANNSRLQQLQQPQPAMPPQQPMVNDMLMPPGVGPVYFSPLDRVGMVNALARALKSLLPPTAVNENIRQSAITLEKRFFQNSRDRATYLSLVRQQCQIFQREIQEAQRRAAAGRPPPQPRPVPPPGPGMNVPGVNGLPMDPQMPPRPVLRHFGPNLMEMMAPQRPAATPQQSHQLQDIRQQQMLGMQMDPPPSLGGAAGGQAGGVCVPGGGGMGRGVTGTVAGGTPQTPVHGIRQMQAQAQMAAQQAQHAQQQAPLHQQQPTPAAAASTGGGNPANPPGAAAIATSAPIGAANHGANVTNLSNNPMPQQQPQQQHQQSQELTHASFQLTSSDEKPKWTKITCGVFLERDFEAVVIPGDMGIVEACKVGREYVYDIR
ncbi:hypothetical protein HDV00_006819 [Rhizophlyctis rosea]|nr:hypothetical protein HDV00_006819 [Rhizophlyctis rosea]